MKLATDKCPFVAKLSRHHTAKQIGPSSCNPVLDGSRRTDRNTIGHQIVIALIHDGIAYPGYQGIIDGFLKRHEVLPIKGRGVLDQR